MFIKKIICLFLSFTTLFGYSFNFRKTYKEADYEPHMEVTRNMEKFKGIFSEVKDCGGIPALYINGKVYPSVAYMTYFEQFNNYKNFADAGYNFFSVPVLFSGRWINSTANTPPFKKGIFDDKNSPDFSLFDESIERILKECPDAYIFPRVNISMPLWWEQENPDEVNIKSDGTSCRESMYSEKWLSDAEKMLREFVKYVNNSKYAPHIVGYQIAGGNTEEWFHFDMNAGCCKNAENGYKKFLQKYYSDFDFCGLPDISKLNQKADYHNDENLARFLEYASFAIADAICGFASAVKEETGGNVVVGTFYGYSLEVQSPLHGTHALKVLLNDKNIDFICSPCSYIGVRNSDADWTEMYPADSVRLHGKMCFQECDIRTNLTTFICEKDPALDPEKVYTASIWKGPETEEESIENLRKAFCRQLIKGNALWWFDMWGGWFDSENIMAEMTLYKKIYEESLSLTQRKGKSELAVFVDESAYKYMTDNSHRNAIYNQRKELGLMGAPYDVYDLSDFSEVYENYKAVIFMSDTKTDYMKTAISICKENKIPYIMSTAVKEKFSVKELRAFCESNGIKIYCESNDIVYVNDNFVAIHAVSDGEKIIYLDDEKEISQIIPQKKETVISDKITVKMSRGETILFSTK
ncbi:MAG: hypothetical protein MJ147_04225 [Clostridia bacterium]|nr:hypothetical protein [Clostridia bacterium]